MNRRLLLALASIALASNLTDCGRGTAPSPTTVVAQLASQEWPLNGGTADGVRHSPLTAINASNVARLGLAWEFNGFVLHGRTHYGTQSNPILVDGVLYFSGPWGIAYAVDARTGKLLWQYDHQANGQSARNGCCGAVSRGLAVWKGKVYSASLDGFLAALDSRTGALLWKIDTFTDRHWNLTITGAPTIAGSNVMIGNAGADMGARGYVSAFDLNTGKLAWRFWATPGDPRNGPDETPEVTLARKTWPATTHWELGMGGNAWDSLAYDPETHIAYLGMGNGGPHPAWLRGSAGADNLYLSSIVAVDATTGKMKWYYQTTPGDSWDYGATSPMVFADLTIAGTVRKVIMQAPKNGLFYVLDRITGELLRADPYTTVNWTSGVDMKTGRPRVTANADYSARPKIIWPSAAGGHSWTPMSFDQRLGLIYLSVFDAPMRFVAPLKAEFIAGTLNQANNGEFPPFTRATDAAELAGQPNPKFETRLKAWDPLTGTARWISEPRPFMSGGTLLAGDLVFQGSSDGRLSAYDAATGRLITSLFTGTSMTGAPIAYQLDGVEYIAILAGAGGPQVGAFAPDTAAATYENTERLLVFKLDGSAIPLPPKRAAAPVYPLPEALPASAATLARGEQLFRKNCRRCHVVGGAVGAYPNLWNMPPGTIAVFDQVVLKGLYRNGGMADFSDILSVSDVAAIKAFVVNDSIRTRSQRTAP
jgi:quinohemoprotein ethanol dehydrogenase